MRMRLPFAAVFLASGSAVAQDIGRDFVVGQRAAYLLAPASVAIPSSVSWTQWSLDGHALMALQTEESAGWSAVLAAVSNEKPAVAPVQPGLVLWNRLERKAATVYKFASEKTQVSQVAWIDGSAVALVNVSEETVTEDGKPGIKQTLLRVALSGEPAGVLWTEVGTPSRRLAIWVADAPGKGPAYVLVRHATLPENASPGALESSVIPIQPDGRLGRAIKTPKDYVAGDMYYDSQGQPWVRLQSAIDSPSAPEAKGAWGLLDVRAGTLHITDNNQVLVKAPPTIEDSGARITLAAGTEKASIAKSTAAITPLWLAADKEGVRQYALVCADARMGAISPSQDAVSYVSQGALVVRDIVKAPLSLVQTAVQEAERLATIAQAKQCGLALMMYAADSDDQLPSSEEFSPNKLGEYMKSLADLSGFTYTFRGGRISDIPVPADTELGYVRGNGGRAVVYADTHVKWVPGEG